MGGRKERFFESGIVEFKEDRGKTKNQREESISDART